MYNKGKKAVVNITYELDNLLAKMQKVIKNSENINSNAMRAFTITYDILMRFYSENQFNSLSKNTIKNLKSVSNILILDFLKKELSNKSMKSNSNNIIDVDLADET